MSVFETTAVLNAQTQEKDRFVTTAAGEQILPVAALPAQDEYTVIVWIDLRRDTAIYAQKIDNDNGFPQWEPYDGVPVCTVTGHKRNPVAVFDTMGGVIIGWEDFRNRRYASKDEDSTVSEIYAQRLLLTNGTMDATWTSGGNTGGVAICAGTDEIARDLRMVGSPDGAFFTWTDYRNSSGYPNYNDRDVYAQYILSSTATWPSGGSWASNGTQVSSNEYDQEQPDIALDFTRSGGNDRYGVLIVYEDNRQDWFQIYCNNILPDGSNNWANDLRLASSSTWQYHPRIASSGTIDDGIAPNGALVVWEDDANSDASDVDIHGQGIDEQGTPFWPSGGPPYSGVAICTAPYDQTRPRVAAYDDVGIAVWEDDRNVATNGTDIFANLVFLSSGNLHETAGSCIAIADQTAEQSLPEVDFSPDGGEMYICWEDERNSATSDADIYAQGIYNQTGYDARWGTNGQAVTEADEDQAVPTIAGEVIAWQDSRRIAVTGDSRTDDDIYAETFGNECDDPTDMHWRDVFVKHTASTDAEGHRFAVDEDGNRYLIWQETRGSTVGDAVFIQKLDRDGVPRWENNGLMLSDSSEHGEIPDVCPDGSGGAYACWLEDTDDVKLTRVSSAGTVGTVASVSSTGSEPRVVENRTLSTRNGCYVAYIDDGEDVIVKRYNTSVQYQDIETDPVAGTLSNLQLTSSYESGVWYAVYDADAPGLHFGYWTGSVGFLAWTSNEDADDFDIVTDRFSFSNTTVKTPTYPQHYDLLVAWKLTDDSEIGVARVAVDNVGNLAFIDNSITVANSNSKPDDFVAAYSPCIAIDSVAQITSPTPELGGAIVAWTNYYYDQVDQEYYYAIQTNRIIWDGSSFAPDRKWDIASAPVLDEEIEFQPEVDIGMQPNGYMEEALTERHGIVVWETDRQLGCSVSSQSLSAARMNYSIANNPPTTDPREWGGYGKELSPGLGTADQTSPTVMTPAHGSELRGVPVFWADERSGDVCLANTIVFDGGGTIAWEKVVTENAVAPQPSGLSLSSPYPNPLSRDAQCCVSLTVTGEVRSVRFELVDMLGRSRWLLFDQQVEEGTVRIRFTPDSETHPAGMYRLLLHDGKHVVSRPLLILK
jgi:hypothetical protein